MEMPSFSQIAASGRHVLTAVATVTTTLAALHLISADQAGKITDAFSQISTGATALATGIGALVAVGSALYASWTASKKSQIAAVGAMAQVPGSGVAGVITTPTPEGQALAKSIPTETVAAAGSPDAKAIAATTGR